MSAVTALLARVLNVPERRVDITVEHYSRYRKYRPIFRAAGKKHRVSPFILAGIAIAESDLTPTARNPSSGAAGMMQVMPLHFKAFGWDADDWADPEKNVHAGATIFRDMLNHHKSTSRALAGYLGASTWLKSGQVPAGTKDPLEYAAEVLGRAVQLEVRELAGLV